MSICGSLSCAGKLSSYGFEIVSDFLHKNHNIFRTVIAWCPVNQEKSFLSLKSFKTTVDCTRKNPA